jgi:hypothetical protein
MITEDQLEQLAIQWFQETGWNYVHGAVIAPEVEPSSQPSPTGRRRKAAEREALRTLTPALSHGEREEDGRLAEGRRRGAMPGQVRRRDATPERVLHVVTKPGFRKEQGELLNKERRYPIALTMRGPWGSGLSRFMGFPWASADAFRRSLGRMPCWGGRRWSPTIKSDLMVRFMSEGGATCKGC